MNIFLIVPEPPTPKIPVPIGDWVAPLLLITAIAIAVYYLRKHGNEQKA